MKPKKQIFCMGCNHSKMLFSSKQEAIRFLNYNADSIEELTSKRPIRAYYCEYCGGWHVTSKKKYSYHALTKQFGVEVGGQIYAKVIRAIGEHKGIGEGLQRKIKELRRLLKFQRIDSERCCKVINELIDIFKIVIEFQLVEKHTVNKLLQKFSTLCSVFIEKPRLLT